MFCKDLIGSRRRKIREAYRSVVRVLEAFPEKHQVVVHGNRRDGRWLPLFPSGNTARHGSGLFSAIEQEKMEEFGWDILTMRIKRCEGEREREKREGEEIYEKSTLWEGVHSQEGPRKNCHSLSISTERKRIDRQWYYIFIINISAVVLSISITPLPAGQTALQTP